MAYIDDVRAGTEDDLYVRSTGQDPARSPAVSEESTPRQIPANGVARPTHVGDILELLYRAKQQVIKYVEESTPRQIPANGVARPTHVGDILELLYRSTDVTADELEVKHEPREQAVQVWDFGRYLNDMYQSCCVLIRRAQLWDQDGDGLIENSGLPDQTFDAWVMTGPSAYCGGLWLAALSSVKYMAHLLEKEADEREFSKLLEQAKHSYHEKLWTGSFYSFDARPTSKNVVMADQLAGQWYLRASGSSDDVFPEVNVKKALRTIYENNVLKFQDGRMGAINGWVTGPKGHVDHTAVQSMEVWTGVTYGLAALMIFEGMHEEAFTTAGGMNKALIKMGLSYETPEALFETGHHRSIAYMRPLAIWGMYQALVSRPPPPAPVANGQPNHVKDKL
ncbi:glycosyl-hydrolase family [Phthorimaea operculella]|nr:glycosyl-hydrolase family [Phthorimaea operculella]